MKNEILKWVFKTAFVPKKRVKIFSSPTLHHFLRELLFTALTLILQGLAQETIIRHRHHAFIIIFQRKQIGFYQGFGPSLARCLLHGLFCMACFFSLPASYQPTLPRARENSLLPRVCTFHPEGALRLVSPITQATRSVDETRLWIVYFRRYKLTPKCKHGSQ